MLLFYRLLLVSYKRPPKNFDAQANKQEEIKLSRDLQNEMFTFLLRKKDKYTVDFQDPDKTNTLLRKAGVFDKIDEIGIDSLAKILGVDAIIKSSYSYEKTSSEGAAIAKTLLFEGIGAKTGSGQLVMQIKNGVDGELLWRFSKDMNDGVFSSASELMERMMRKVSRNFPYEK
ncbi:hypothetical protein ACFOW1_02215 [Parasediminibacterium paludis]|uniref:DUF4136 domain-containing protein n=1 Tax=Parasediminibacterium paludis TaxID=908966 RepID=A0ABV8PRJ5_9BACT